MSENATIKFIQKQKKVRHRFDRQIIACDNNAISMAFADWSDGHLNSLKQHLSPRPNSSLSVSISVFLDSTNLNWALYSYA